MKVEITVNGASTSADVEPRLLLAHYLRDVVGLKATNIGCDTTSCGACTVLLDGESVKSCTLLAAQADGGSRSPRWKGSRRAADELHPVAAAFRAEHGLQCGFCTPGMVMAAVGLLSENPKPTEREVREGLEGNLCRCTGYHNIVRAVIAASGQDPDAVQGAAIHRVTDAGGVEAAAGLLVGRLAGAAHDPRRLRLRTARHARRRAGAAGRARRGRQGARGRPLAAAGDEAAPRRARAGDRHRAAGRAALRRASTATSSPSARAPATTTSRRRTCVAAEAPLLGGRRAHGRRPAGAPPRHPRRLARARRPGLRPARRRARARAARSCCAGRAGSGGCRSTSSSPGLFTTAVEPDELIVEVRVPRTGGGGLGVREVHPAGQRLGDRGGRGRRRAGRAGEHGLHAAAGVGHRGRAGRGRVDRRTPPRWPTRAPTRPATSPPPPPTAATWPAC